MIQVADLRNPGTNVGLPSFEETELAAQTLGVHLHPVDAQAAEDLNSAFQAATALGA